MAVKCDRLDAEEEQCSEEFLECDVLMLFEAKRPMSGHPGFDGTFGLRRTSLTSWSTARRTIQYTSGWIMQNSTVQSRLLTFISIILYLFVSARATVLDHSWARASSS